MAAETDPEKIAAALERTKRARLAARPKNYEDAAGQILPHSFEAGQITEEELRLRLEEVKTFVQKQRTQSHGNSN